MADKNTVFCRLLLRQVRHDCKVAGVKLPKFQTYSSSSLGSYGQKYYEIFLGGKQCELDYFLNEGIIWTGEASNAYEARYNAIMYYLERLELGDRLSIDKHFNVDTVHFQS